MQGAAKHREVFGVPDSLGEKQLPRQEAGLAASSPCPTFLGGRSWGKAQGRWEPGGDSVGGSHPRTRRRRAGEGAL